jgi:hypothetical protein
MTFRLDLPSSDAAILGPLLAADKAAVSLVTSKRFDGSPELLQVIIIGAAGLMIKLAPHIAQVICKQIEARRYVEVEYNGFKLKGLKIRDAEKMLLDVIKRESSTDAQPTEQRCED